MKIIEKSFQNSIPDGFCKIFDGLIMILSLGFLYSSLHMTFVEWRVRRKISRMKK